MSLSTPPRDPPTLTPSRRRSTLLNFQLISPLSCEVLMRCFGTVQRARACCQVQQVNGEAKAKGFGCCWLQSILFVAHREKTKIQKSRKKHFSGGPHSSERWLQGSIGRDWGGDEVWEEALRDGEGRLRSASKTRFDYASFLVSTHFSLLVIFSRVPSLLRFFSRRSRPQPR